MLIQWQFRPVDTWFFREARSHDAVGVSQLNSVFPPPASTLAGAIRTQLGDLLGVDWQPFAADDPSLASMSVLLGDGEHLGQLRITQIELECDGQVLYPAPADLLQSWQAQAPGYQLHRLGIGAPVHCDLGKVALAEIPAGVDRGCKPLEQAWLTANGVQQWLSGAVPSAQELVRVERLFSSESRLGIARDVARGTVKTGLLYQTRHLRPIDSLRITVYGELDAVPAALASCLPLETSIRLGSEGRAAAVVVRAAPPRHEPVPPSPPSHTRGLTLLLVSPGRFEATPGGCLPGFTAVTDAEGDTLYWRGQIADIPLKLISAVIPRPLRQGGWDQKKQQPKPLTGLVAPGSVYYCERDAGAPDLPTCLSRCHGSRIGDDGALGYGRLLAGLWLQR